MDPSTTSQEPPSAQIPAREDLLKQHSYSILKSHMALALEDSAIDTCLQGVHNYKQLNDIAKFVKREIDRKNLPLTGVNGVFHCICGTSFASALSFQTHHFLHMKVDNLHIIISKSLDNAPEI